MNSFASIIRVVAQDLSCKLARLLTASRSSLTNCMGLMPRFGLVDIKNAFVGIQPPVCGSRKHLICIVIHFVPVHVTRPIGSCAWRPKYALMGRVKKTQIAWDLGSLAQAGRLQCAPRAKGCRLDSGKAGRGRKPGSEDHSKDRGGTDNDFDFNPP